jgi:hypothetical protein
MALFIPCYNERQNGKVVLYDYHLTNHKFRSYRDVAAYYANCRSHKKGKPLFSWGRIHKVGDSYVFSHRYNGKFAVVHPDDTLEFDIEHDTNRLSPTLTTAFPKVFPLHWFRVTTGTHGVVTSKSIRQVHSDYTPPPARDAYAQRRDMEKQAAKLARLIRTGLKLNLRTQEWAEDEVSNASPFPKIANKDAHTLWQRKMKAFTFAMKTRAKLGAFNSIESEYKYINWHSETQWRPLYDAIVQEVYPTDLVAQFINSGAYRTLPYQEIMSRITRVINRTRPHMRREFGVFDKPKEENVND